MENHDERRRRDEERGQARDYGRSDEGPGRRDEPRYGKAGGSERSAFSPDWAREGEQPRHSDDPYYARNRERGSEFSYAGGSGYLYSESLTLRGPYAGRGPKGYKRSDQQIIDEACQRLERDGEIDASEIEVSAEEGVIRLRGTVRDRNTKRRAEECVESVYGTRDVMNELRVSQGAAGSPSSQSSQASQGSQASLGGGSQTAAPGSRPGAGQQAGADQPGDDKRTPRH